MNTLVKRNPLLTRFMALFFSFALALSMVPITALQANAAEVASDDWGGCHWTLDDQGTLVLGSGKGADTGGVCPWFAHAAAIYSVEFTSGFITPDDYSNLFDGCANLTKMVFNPGSLLRMANFLDENSIWCIDNGNVQGAAYRPQQIFESDHFKASGGTFMKQADGVSNTITEMKFPNDSNTYTYTYDKTTPNIRVYAEGGVLLTEGDHYELVYDTDPYQADVDREGGDVDNGEASFKNVTINGKNCYEGSSPISGQYKIEPSAIAVATTDIVNLPFGTSLPPSEFKVVMANGEEIQISPRGGYRGDINGWNNSDGYHEYTVTGFGNYTGSATFKYNIESGGEPEPEKTDISGVTIDVTHFVYNGEQQIPAVKDGDKTLVLNEDYTVIVNDSVLGSDATNAGEKTMTIYGKGDYEKSTSRQYTIAPIDISPDASPLADVKINLSQKTFDYDDGNAQMVGVDSVEVNGRSLKLHSDSDYSPYDYYEIVEGTNTGSAPDTYAVQVRGLGNYTGTRSENWLIIDPSNPVKPIVSLELSDEDFTFIEGKEQIPTIIVKDADGNIVKPANYNVKITNEDGEEDAITAGTKTVTVTANGDAYSGELTDTYEIKAAPVVNPPKPDDPKPNDPKPNDPTTPDNPNTPSNTQNPGTSNTPGDSQTPGTPNNPSPSGDTITMYRLYNPHNGEHFYTANEEEHEFLADIGWDDEGVGWIAPKSGDPVYRLYNKEAGEHHYTRSIFEKITLVDLGWTDEGVGWYSDKNMGTPLYRLYNPNQYANNHHYTLSKYEHDILVGLGWQDERVSWWGVSAE